MGYQDEKINYTNFLRDKPQDTDHAKLTAMKEAVINALKARNVHGHICCCYYKDGCVSISNDGEFYGVFDTKTGEFFSGCVGD